MSNFSEQRLGRIYRQEVEDIIRKATYLTEQDFITLLQARSSYQKKFEQLLPGMYYLVYDGYDEFDHEILEVDIVNRRLRVIDHSLSKFPDKHIDYWTGRSFPIPHDLYLNKEDMLKANKFKFD